MFLSCLNEGCDDDDDDDDDVPDVLIHVTNFRLRLLAFTFPVTINNVYT